MCCSMAAVIPALNSDGFVGVLYYVRSLQVVLLCGAAIELLKFVKKIVPSSTGMMVSALLLK